MHICVHTYTYKLLKFKASVINIYYEWMTVGILYIILIILSYTSITYITPKIIT